MNRILVISFTLVQLFFLNIQASEPEASAIRRLAIFPIASEDISQGLKSSLWWDFRKDLAADGRFVVASKQFLELKEVYQERKALSPSDAILLSKHLEADALICLEYSNRELHLRSYSKDDGMMLIHLSETLPTHFTAEARLNEAFQRLIAKWYAYMPVQAYSTKQTNNIIHVQSGNNISKDLLEEAYLVKIERQSLGPLWDKNFKRKTLAKLSYIEGKGNSHQYKLSNEVPNLKIHRQMNIWVPKLEEYQRKKALGVSNQVSTDNMLHELKKSSAKDKDEDSSYTKISALVNILVILALSL